MVLVAVWIGAVIGFAWAAVEIMENDRMVPAGRPFLLALVAVILGVLVVPSTPVIWRWLRHQPEYVIDDLGITWGGDALRDPFVAWADIQSVTAGQIQSRYVSDRVIVVRSRRPWREAAAGLGRWRRWGMAASDWLSGEPYQMSTTLTTPGYEVIAAEIEARMGRPIEPD